MWINRQLRIFSSLVIAAFLTGATSLHAQRLSSRLKSGGLNFSISSSPAPENDITLANQALAALKRLEADVIVYRSLTDFEGNGRIARVSFDTFTADLGRVISEVEPILVQLSDNRLRAHLTNALASYRDGAFWWARIVQPRVVAIKELSFDSKSAAPSEVFFAGTMPYTVAIHWRQASKFLLTAEHFVTPKVLQKF